MPLGIVGEIVGRQPELGENFLDRDSFSSSLLEPSLGTGKGLALGIGNRLVVDGSLCDGLGNRVRDDSFEDTDDGGKL